MAARLRHATPEAWRNIVGRMLEAHGRGYWTPEEETIDKLQALYDQADEALEGVSVDALAPST